MALIPYAGKEPDSGAEWKRGGAPTAKGSPRNQAILRRHNAGDSHVDIAATYGLTRERVRQIVQKLEGKPRRGPQKKR